MKKKTKEVANKNWKEWQEIVKYNHDWDYAYILDILKYKLERVKKCLVANDIIQGAKQKGKEIQQVVDLLARVRDNNYEYDMFKKLDKKYKTPKHKIVKEPGKPYSRFVSGSEQLPKEKQAPYYKELRAGLKQAEKDRHNDLKQAFDLIQKHIWGWWD